MKHTWIFVTGLFLLVSGCQQPPPPLPKPQLLTPPTFDVGWQFATGDKSPIVNMYCEGAYLFAYTQSGTSYVLERKTGRIVQIDDVPAATGQMKAPAILKDQIAYATSDAIQIYDMHGNLTRTIPLGYTLTSGIAGSKNMLFVAEAYPDGGRLAGIDLDLLGGTTYDPRVQVIKAVPKRWEYLVQHVGIVSTPVVFNDAVYVAGEDGSVAALATSDRGPLWPTANGTFPCGGAVLADLAVDEFGLYVASYDSKLYCLNPNNGKVRWQYYAQAPLTVAPVATKDLVFEFVPGAGVVAIDKTSASAGPNTPKPTFDRTPRWMAGNCTQFLAEDGKYVYLLRNDHRISARNKDTGEEVFASKRSDFIAVASNNNYGALVPSPADSAVYATLGNGTILSINAVTLPGIIGQMVWDNVGRDPGRAAPDTALASTKAPRAAGGTLFSGSLP